MILLLSRNEIRHNCIFASIVFSTQNQVLYKACVVNTGQSVFTRIPTWYCECPVTKNHLASSMFNGSSSGISGHAEPSTISMPNNQAHRKASHIMSKKHAWTDLTTPPRHQSHHRNRSAMLKQILNARLAQIVECNNAKALHNTRTIGAQEA